MSSEGAEKEERKNEVGSTPNAAQRAAGTQKGAPAPRGTRQPAAEGRPGTGRDTLRPRAQPGRSRGPRPGRPPCCAVSRAAKPPRTQSRQGWGRRGGPGLTAWRVQAAASERRSRFGPRRRRRHSTANVLRAAESHAFKRPTSRDVNFAAIENFLTDGLNLGAREGITRRKEFREGRNGFGPTNACRPLTPRWPCAHCR